MEPRDHRDPARGNATGTTHVGVIGAGTMGCGIAQLAAQSGYRVTVVDASGEALERCRSSLADILGRLEAKGRVEDAAATLELIRFEGSFEALADASWVLEAAPERLELKRELFARLEEAAPAAVLATNTSTLSIAAIAAATNDPSRVVGLHFFNPAPLMRLVEVVPGPRTAPGVAEGALAFARSLGREPVLVRDAPGFLVNRVARPFYGEALRLLAAGASCASVDEALRSAGFRMGPFELMDLIGVDVNFASTMSVFEATFGEPRYRPHPLQAQQVAAGLLGRKTGRGFYAYPREEEEEEVPAGGASRGGPSRLPRVGIVGDGAVARVLRARFGGVGTDDPEFVLDARVALERKRGEPLETRAAVATLAWAHSASAAAALYPNAANVVGFGFAPPGDDDAGPGTVELLPPLGMANDQLEPFRAAFDAAGFRSLVLPDVPGGAAFRTVAMLVNEAASALAERLASAEGIDRAMRLGTNYPWGPLEWSERLGLADVLAALEGLHAEEGDERYRPHGFLRRVVARGLSWREATREWAP